MKKILFIEDEQTLQKTMGDILIKEGYKMVSALDGEIGLRLAKSEEPDLILLDMILPRMEGFNVLKELKKNPKTREIPVIVLTNLESAEDVEKALNAGATNYLVKTDFTLVEVIGKIKKLLK